MAEEKAKVAAQKAEEARARSLRDDRTRGDASSWAMLEAAQAQAIAQAKSAAHDARALRQAADGVRVQYTHAHQRAEVVRRVVDHRREETVRELDRAEDKSLDEVAVLMFNRKLG